MGCHSEQPGIATFLDGGSDHGGVGRPPVPQALYARDLRLLRGRVCQGAAGACTTAQAQASHAGRARRRCLLQLPGSRRAWRNACSSARAQNGIKIIKNDRAVRFVDAGNGRVGTVELKSGTKARLSHPEAYWAR